MRSRSHSLSLFPSTSSAVETTHPRFIPADQLRSSNRTPGALRGTRELWLALHLPHFMLDALGSAIAQLRSATNPVSTRRNGATRSNSFMTSSRGATPPPAPHALAIVDLDHGGKVICACDARAAAAGIAPGMALNSALALLPELHTLARDPQREHGLLVAIAEWAVRFTPRVSLEPPDAVLLEVRGSLRLFGGSRRLCERLRAELCAAGLEPLFSLTPVPMASLWMARTGRKGVIRRPADLASRLADLPIRCTRWPERSLETLATMGVRTVGDCLRLPRDGFARRFEPRLLGMLDRAVGRRPDPREGFTPRERFAAGRDLEPEITDTARLDVAAAPLLDELGAFLRKRGASVQALELRLVHRETPTTRLRLRFMEPVADTARIAALLRERLARIVLPAPVRALRLRSAPLVESGAASTELFALDRDRSGAGVPQLVERLRARLGTEAVYGLCLIPEHRPESAWRVAEPTLPGRARSRSRRSQPGRRPQPGRHPQQECVPESAAGKPLWLLAEPQPLEGGEQPSFEGTLELEQGPERIESGWWDGRDVQRDYYVARNPAGVRLWIFRDRGSLPGVRHAADPHARWFLHGVFG